MNKTVYYISAVATTIGAMGAAVAVSGAFEPTVVAVGAIITAGAQALVTFLARPAAGE